jgi:hypothetical protein
MFVYNISIKVEKEILSQWIKWQKEEHIPAIMATNLFTENKFFELMESDPDSSTFVLQYFSESQENIDKYFSEYSEQLREETFKKWGNKIISFTTFMQTVQ